MCVLDGVVDAPQCRLIEALAVHIQHTSRDNVTAGGVGWGVGGNKGWSPGRDHQRRHVTAWEEQSGKSCCLEGCGEEALGVHTNRKSRDNEVAEAMTRQGLLSAGMG